MWDVYGTLLRVLKCMPSELDRQDVEDMWRLLKAYGDGNEADEEDIPEELKFMYGL